MRATGPRGRVWAGCLIGCWSAPAAHGGGGAAAQRAALGVASGFRAAPHGGPPWQPGGLGENFAKSKFSDASDPAGGSALRRA